MKFGLFGINIGAFALDHRLAADAALAAEECGWDSVWAAEHYVLPDPAVPESPARPGTPFLDPWQSLVNIAVHTERVSVGTGVTVVPYHNPIVLAKKVASLDRISNGRFLFGVGVGYLEPEFTALGLSPAERGKYTDESLEVLRALWTGDRVAVEFQGRRITGVSAHPGPSRHNGPPVIVGGSGTAAWRRAARYGDGYYGWLMDPAQARVAVDGIRTAEDIGKPDTPKEPLAISITPPAQMVVNPDVVNAYATTGVSRLILLPPPTDDQTKLMEFITQPPWRA